MCPRIKSTVGNWIPQIIQRFLFEWGFPQLSPDLFLQLLPQQCTLLCACPCLAQSPVGSGRSMKERNIGVKLCCLRAPLCVQHPSPQVLWGKGHPWNTQFRWEAGKTTPTADRDDQVFMEKQDSWVQLCWGGRMRWGKMRSTWNPRRWMGKELEMREATTFPEVCK